MEERGDWPLDSLQQKDVCACHFEDEYLKKMVTDKGHHGMCSYCGKKDVVRNMYDLGEDIAWKVGLYFVDPVNADFMLAKGFYDDDDVTSSRSPSFGGENVPFHFSPTFD